MKRRIYLLNCLLASALLSGCMGYKLGNEGASGIETVYIKPVINKSKEPAIEIVVTRALREKIQFDGRLTLVNEPESADAIISVRLTQYSLNAIAYRRDLSTAARGYRIRVTGTATMSSRRTGEIISTSNTYGENIFEFGSDLTTSKRIALPPAAQELAKFMVDDLIERW